MNIMRCLVSTASRQNLRTLFSCMVKRDKMLIEILYYINVFDVKTSGDSICISSSHGMQRF